MKRIPPVLILLLLFPLLVYGGKRTPKRIKCPVDGTPFRAHEVQFHPKLAFGGIDWDFCPHYFRSFRSLELEDLVWTCPSCGFSLPFRDFQKTLPFVEEKARLVMEALTAPVPLDRNMDQREIPGWSKWDLFAQLRKLEKADPGELGNIHLQASWAARQRGSVYLPEFAEWTEVLSRYGIDKSPMDIGLKKNRREYELARAEKIERDLTEGKWRTGHRAVLVRYLAAWLYRRRGENTDALRLMGNLEPFRGDYSFIDDAVSKMKESIEIERRCQRKALECFLSALEKTRHPGSKRLHHYRVGELHRRLEAWGPAREHYEACIALGESGLAEMAADRLATLPPPDVPTGPSKPPEKKP